MDVSEFICNFADNNSLEIEEVIYVVKYIGQSKNTV